MLTRVALTLILALTLPTLAQDQPNLTGTWEHKGANGETITFTLNPDGSAKIDDEAAKYTVNGNTISVVLAGETIRYTFKLEGDAMTVSGGDLDQPTPFTRKAAATPKRGLGAKIKSAPADKTETPKSFDVAGTQTGEAKPDAKPNAAGSASADGTITKTPSPAASTPIGTWSAQDGDKLEIRADALVYQGTSIQAQDTGKAIRVTFQGQTMDWPYELSGDSMKISIGGQPLTLKRVGAPPVAAASGNSRDNDDRKTDQPAANNDSKSLIGTWDGPDGTVTVRADGTVRSGGQDFKWSADANTLTLSDDKNWVKIPYKLDGDKLVLGTGPSKTLTRNKGGLAGVWMAQESSLDPQFFQSVTQYVSLFPDGSVGFAKSEGGATRTAVTEHLERFSSYKNNQNNAGKTYGKWQQEGDTVSIQWQGAFNNATWQGHINPKNNKLVIRGAGILNQGATLEYERQ
jgi:hypothetical protein